jgi:hypothetical protein
MCMCQNCSLPRRWSGIPYAGELRHPPREEPAASSWPTYFLHRELNGGFSDHRGRPVAFEIRHPDTIDFEGEQLPVVKETLQNLTEAQIRMAEYWNAGPPTKQLAPIIDRLIDTYAISAPRAGRILAAVHSGISDAFAVTWHFKYHWDIPRPNQLDQELATIICTPRHPSYPAGHGVIACCAEVILSYFFPPEADRLKALAEECAISRLYGGVHYPADNLEGMRLGRQIGRLVVASLSEQHDNAFARIDYVIQDGRNAHLPPMYKPSAFHESGAVDQDWIHVRTQLPVGGTTDIQAAMKARGAPRASA